MLKQLMDHCDENNLLLDFQSAYREHYSTETSLLKMVSDIMWNFERQNITTAAILDVSVSFDTIDHNVLLTVLKDHFGLCDNALSWFENIPVTKILQSMHRKGKIVFHKGHAVEHISSHTAVH